MKNTAIIFSYLSLFCIGLMENSRGAFYVDFVKLFDVTSSSGSLLFSISSLAAFVATISSRYWLFKFSSISTTKFGLVLLLVACTAFYFTTNNFLSFNIFMAFNILYGIGIGLLSISLNNLVCENSSLSKRSKLLSGLHSMYGLASLVAPYIVSGLYASDLNWSLVFIVLSSFAVGVLIYSLFLSSEKLVENKQSLEFANPKLYCLVGIAGALYVASEVIISSRLSFYLVNSFKLDKIQANYLLSLFFICLFLGRFLGSVIDIRKSKVTLLKFSLFVTILILLIGLNFYPPLIALSALSMSYFFPYYMSFISENFEKLQKDLIAKLMNFVGGFLFLSHWAFGVISDTYSLNLAMYLPVLFLSLSLYILHRLLTKAA